MQTDPFSVSWIGIKEKYHSEFLYTLFKEKH